MNEKFSKKTNAKILKYLNAVSAYPAQTGDTTRQIKI